MLAKPGKPPENPASYRPISLLPVICKLFEKLFYTRLIPIIQDRNLIPDHQFGFRKKHSTIDQVHRVTRHITQALETKKFCSALFLDVSQAFDRVWHEGLMHKLSAMLPSKICAIICSYLNDCSFQVSFGAAKLRKFAIKAGVPQSSFLGPILYLLFTADIPAPTNRGTLSATFADDSATLSSAPTYEEANTNLQ